MKFDGGTKGPSNSKTPKHTQETNIIQVDYESKQRAEEMIFPKAKKAKLTQGEGAVSSFPVKY